MTESAKTTKFSTVSYTILKVSIIASVSGVINTVEQLCKAYAWMIMIA